MSATDELRRLLDERGVEYLDSEDDTTIYYADSGYRYTYNVNPESGWAQLFGYHLTPKQAIAATLGSGTLTAEQVRESVMSADRWKKPMGDTGLTNTHLIIRDDGWRAIADELNARAELTCRMELADISSGSAYRDVWLCGACGEHIEQHTVMGKSDPPNYCPNCGAKVIGG